MRFWKSDICSNQLGVCEKQTSVSHSSTESEIIFLDAGLRLDGKPALDLWDLIIAVLHGNTNQSNQEQGDLCMNQREVRSSHNSKTKAISWTMFVLFPQTSILLTRKFC